MIVFIENGYTRIMTPKGEVLKEEVKGVLESSVLDKNGEINSSKVAYYTASFVVTLASNREEALKLCQDQVDDTVRG